MAKQTKLRQLSAKQKQLYDDEEELVIHSQSDGLYECDQEEFSNAETSSSQASQICKYSTPSYEELSKEIDLLRKVYLSESRRGHESNTLIKNLQFSNAGAPVDGTPLIISLNSIATGQDSNDRLGPSIWNHGCTIRLVANYLPTVSANVAVLAPAFIRAVIYRDKVPLTTPPTYAQAFNTGAAPITDQDALFGTLGTGDVQSVRNPVTFDRFHVLHDEYIHVPARPVMSTATTGYFTGAIIKTIHVDFNKSKTTYFAGALTDIATNQLTMIVMSNSAATKGGAIGVGWTVHTTFSDAPDT